MTKYISFQIYISYSPLPPPPILPLTRPGPLPLSYHSPCLSPHIPNPNSTPIELGYTANRRILYKTNRRLQGIQ